MKRSMMIKILIDAVNENVYQDSQIGEHEANNILETIEHSGMIPPEGTKIMGYNKERKPVTYPVREWEPENDTN